MPGRPVAAPVLALLIVVSGPQAAPPPQPAVTFPFETLRSASDRARLERGDPVVKVLPAGGRDLHVLGIAATTATVEQLRAASTGLDVLQKDSTLLGGGRISATPTAADFAGVVLGESDLADLRECRVGDCGMKLSTGEIRRVRRAIAEAGPAWRSALQTTFRGILLDRALAYLTRRHAGMAPYTDRRTPVDSGAELVSIARQAILTPWIRPSEMDAFVVPAPVEHPVVGSFLSWSMTSYGGKPVTALTHTVVVECGGAGRPLLTTIAAQVFATHYFDGSVAVTSLIERQQRRYLIYLHASRLDIFDGWLGGITRRMVERRLREAGPAVLGRFRERLQNVGAHPDG